VPAKHRESIWDRDLMPKVTTASFGWIRILLNRCPEDVPRALWHHVRRRVGWIALALIALMVSMFAVAIYWEYFATTKSIYGSLRVNNFLNWLQVFFWLCFLLIMPVTAQLTAKSLRRRIRVHDGNICLDCSYALKGLGQSGKCPECGAGFNVRSNRKAWARQFPGLWGDDDPDHSPAEDQSSLARRTIWTRPLFNSSVTVQLKTGRILLGARPPRVVPALWRELMDELWLVRMVFWILLMVFAALFVGFLSQQYFDVPSIPMPSVTQFWTWWFPIYLVNYLVAALRVRSVSRAMHAKLEKYHGQLCTACGYVLAAHEDSGTCPECGEDYSIVDAQEQWERCFPDFSWSVYRKVIDSAS